MPVESDNLQGLGFTDMAARATVRAIRLDSTAPVRGSLMIVRYGKNSNRDVGFKIDDVVREAPNRGLGERPDRAEAAAPESRYRAIG